MGSGAALFVWGDSNSESRREGFAHHNLEYQSKKATR